MDVYVREDMNGGERSAYTTLDAALETAMVVPVYDSGGGIVDVRKVKLDVITYPSGREWSCVEPTTNKVLRRVYRLTLYDTRPKDSDEHTFTIRVTVDKDQIRKAIRCESLS